MWSYQSSLTHSREGASSLPQHQSLGTQVVVRHVTNGAALTKISVFFNVCAARLPHHFIAVHADACPSTKRDLPRHKQ